MNIDRLYIPTILKTRINLECHEMTHNISATLERKLQEKYSRKPCTRNGYIKRGSLRLVEKSKGSIRPAHSTGQATYIVTFKVDLYVPTVNSIVKAQIRNTNKAALLAIADPLQILIPRQGNFTQDANLFNQYRNGDIVNVKIRQFRLEPDYIFAVGSLENFIMETEKMYLIPHGNLDLSNLKISLEHTTTMPAIKTEIYGDPQPLYQKKSEIDPHENIWRSHIRYFINPFELLDNPAYNKETVVRFQHVWDRKTNKWIGTDVATSGTGSETGGKGVPYQPFSRAYYKLREILHDFSILNDWESRSIKVLCLAEGPGGFVQAILDSRGNLATARTTSIWPLP